MASFNFLIIQTVHTFKNVTVEGVSVAEAQKLTEDSFAGVDISQDDDVRSDTHLKVKYLKAIDLDGTNSDDSKKYYVVWVGHKPGVYETWDQCRAQTHGFRKAQFKSFIGKSIAQAAFDSGPEITPPPPSPSSVVVKNIADKKSDESDFFGLHPEDRPGDGPADDDESPFYD